MVAGADGGRKWLPMVWMVPFLFTYVNTAKVIVHFKRENFMQFELNLKNTLIRKNTHTKLTSISVFNIPHAWSCFPKAPNHFIFHLIFKSYHFIYKDFSIHLKESYLELLSRLKF